MAREDYFRNLREGMGGDPVWAAKYQGAAEDWRAEQGQAREAGQLGIQQERTITGMGEFGLQREKEMWDLQKKSAQSTANLTKQFLDQWGVGMSDLKDLYKSILGGGGTGLGALPAEISGPMQEFTDKISAEYESFKTKYEPLETAGIESSLGELAARSGMITQLQDLSKADYEGVSGRAMADVSAQSEMGRQAEARRMMGMGIDPTSGRFGSLTRRSFLDEARNKAIAANIARRGEKERVTGITATGLQLIDPMVGANIASGLSGQRTGLLGMGADVTMVGARTAADIARAKADIVGGYAENVVRPYGELGFTLLGSGMGGVPTTLPGTGIPVGGSGAGYGVSSGYGGAGPIGRSPQITGGGGTSAPTQPIAAATPVAPKATGLPKPTGTGSVFGTAATGYKQYDPASGQWVRVSG